MKRNTLLLTVLATLLFGALFAVSPAAAQEGEVNVTLDPEDATTSVGAVQTYEVVVEDPDSGILGYDNLDIEVDSGVAEIVAFRENHTSNFSLSEIQDNNSTLSLSAATEDDFEQPAANYTLVEFDVEATAGGSTDVSFNQSAGATVTDYNDTAYTIQTLSGATLSVDAPPTFQVSNVQPADATVTNGTEIDVSADIENIGTVAGTQDITLSVGGVSATQTETLNASENTTVTFTDVDTGALGPGSYTHQIASANDSDSGNLTVEAQNTGPQQRLDFNDQTATGGTVTVENVSSDGVLSVVVLTYENNGDLITAGVSQNGTFAGGDVAVQITDGSEIPGEHTAHIIPVSDISSETINTGIISDATLANITDNETAAISAPQRANFQVSNIQPTTATVQNGTVIDVSAEVENTGTVAGTQDITLSVGGLTQTQTETLNASENTTVTFSNVDTGALGPGSYTHEIASANDSASGSLAVEASTTFDLSFGEQSIENGNVTLETSSDGVEAAIVVTYENPGAGETGLVVAGQTVGTFDGGPVQVSLEDTSALGSNYTAHILPANELSDSTQTSGVVSSETASAIEASAEAYVSVEVVDGQLARDTTGDGLLNNVRGADGFNILDVQALFNALETPVLGNNAGLFNFQDSDQGVNILDVQALFNRLSG